MKTFICVLAIFALAMAEDNAEELLYKGNDEFTAKLFKEVAKENAGKSVVLSGFSAMVPLAQLALASAGESHDEILRVIGLPNDNATKAAFLGVTQRLRSVKGVDLKIANRVFLPESYELDSDFATVSRDVFQSEVKNVNFAKNVEAASTINTWVEDNTNHRIKDLVSANSLGPDTRAVLVNAIYFKGSWVNTFNERLTNDRDFHVTPEKTIKVPTMYQSAHFNYGESAELDAKLLELFYEGEEASMLIVLPNKIDGLAALESKLENPSLLQAAIKQMSNTDVDVYLPKFKIETTINLKNVLSKVGINNLFDPVKARLENLLKNKGEKLYVSDAIQKAFIEVNEQGAEAAAASAFQIENRAFIQEYEPPPISKFEANRPFRFILLRNSLAVFNGAYHA